MATIPELSDLEHALWFVKTYCPHWPIIGRDWQTLDGTQKERQKEAERCYAVLEEAGLIELAPRPPRAKPWRSGRPNFIAHSPEERKVCPHCRK